MSTTTAPTAGAARPTVGAALIGCGYWGKNLCRLLEQHRGMDLRWVCDGSAAALQRAESLAPGARRTADLDAVLNDPQTSVVVVATPVVSHFQVALAALRAGKHVFVEKPLTRTAAEARQLCEEAEARNLVLMVGHTYLYNGAVQFVKQLIDDGQLGDIHYVFSRRVNLGIVRQDVDALWNLAPHDLAMLNHWIDRPVEQVTAVGHAFLQPGIADVVFAHLTYAGNLAAHVQVSWLDPGKVRSAIVVGSRGMLVFDDMSTDARIAVYDTNFGALEGPAESGLTLAAPPVLRRGGDVWLPHVEVPEPLGQEIDDLHRCVVDGSRPLADGRNGLLVVSLLERLTAAMQLDGGTAYPPATSFPTLVKLDTRPPDASIPTAPLQEVGA